MSRKILKSSLSEQRQSDTSKILNISEAAGDMREAAFRTEILRLEVLGVGLSQTIDSLLRSAEAKDNEITHLKQMLTGATPLLNVTTILASDEEAIVDIQMRKLKEETMGRSMNLDEVKRLDLLIKNKRLIQADAKPKVNSALPRDVTPMDLLIIASSKIKPE